jgi:hypothetical protein
VTSCQLKHWSLRLALCNVLERDVPLMTEPRPMLKVKGFCPGSCKLKMYDEIFKMSGNKQSRWRLPIM